MMDDLHWQLDALERVVSGEKKPDSLDLQLLRQITGNFSDDRRIGEGGCGVVYKGILPNEVVIAVKKLKNSHTIDEKMFLREVDSMIKVGHQNIVRFLGYCSETKERALQMDGRTVMAEERERLLCFEYIRRGSIDKYLTDELRGFEWCTRYQIIKGICYGLLHLHKEKRILHMDLKPANILLNHQMVPKITDFGLSRIDGISQTTSAQRLLSPGYCAPEYVDNGKWSWKSDIYSLGVIMIELVTGSRQQVPNITKVLRRWRHRWSKSSNHIPLWYQQVKKCLELAVSCKEKNPINRPFIWDVVCELNKLDSWDGQILESSLEEISSSPDDMLGIEPLELHFSLAHEKEITCSIELKNDTDYYMAFRIATTSLLPFSIQPDKGIAAPRSKCRTSITLSTKEMTLLHNHCEEFIVQSTRIDGSITSVDITVETFNEEWGNSKKKIGDVDKVVDEVNLTVVFDLPLLHEDDQKDQVNLSAEMYQLERFRNQYRTDVPAQVSQGDSHAVHFDFETQSQNPPYNLASGLEDANPSYPYLPTVLEEPGSSFSDSEAAEDDPLPGIEGLRITGEPFPGRELQASGYSTNGTMTCNFEWVRHLEDGSVNFIEGAKQPSYVITADDVDTLLAIEVQPLDDRKRKGDFIKVYANDQRKILCDPETKELIKRTLEIGHVTYEVQVLLPQVRFLDLWEPAVLAIKREGYSIKCNGQRGVVITEKFQQGTAIHIPYGRPTEFSITSADDVSYDLKPVENTLLRDTIVLVLRLFNDMALERRRVRKKGLFFK